MRIANSKSYFDSELKFKFQADIERWTSLGESQKVEFRRSNSDFDRFLQDAEVAEVLHVFPETQGLLEWAAILQDQLGVRPFFKRVFLGNEKLSHQDLSHPNEIDFFVLDQTVSYESIKTKIQQELTRFRETQKSREILQIKRQELEQFNAQLSAASSEKLAELRRFIDIEENRKRSEKKLLFFLDFINQEFSAPDFLQKMVEFLWKEGLPSGQIQTLGLQLRGDSFSWLVFYNSKSDRVFYDRSIQFIRPMPTEFVDAPAELSRELANLLKRPAGKIIFSGLEFADTEFHVFLELNQGRSSELQDHLNFFQERLPLIHASVFNWIVNRRLQTQFEVWDSIFKNRIDPVHFINQDFFVLRSNYQHSQMGLNSKACFERLAGRTEPCVGCPVLSKHSVGHVRIKDKKFIVSISKSDSADGAQFLMFYTDETSKDQVQKRHIQSEKMRLLGKLSKHLSHELNNPLSGLKLHVDYLLKSELLPSPAVKDDFTQIQSALTRSINILKDLNAFLSSEEVSIAEHDLKDVVQSTLRLIKSASQEIRFFTDVKSIIVRLHSGLFQQVLFNLLKNAIEAMKYKGILKIYSIQPTSGQDYQLVIEDDGPGLPNQVRAKLFSPFVTTRENQGGTGLGLYIAFEACRKIGLRLEYDETYKSGTRFRIVFPFRN